MTNTGRLIKVYGMDMESEILTSESAIASVTIVTIENQDILVRIWLVGMSSGPKSISTWHILTVDFPSPAP